MIPELRPMEQFEIEIKHNGRLYKFPVQLERSRYFEIYTIQGRNTLKMHNNLPLLLSRGLKYKKPHWKVLEGMITNASVLEVLQKALESRSRESQGF